MVRFRMTALAALFVMCGPAWAEVPASDLPPPVAGITYDEWAAGNARIANGTPEADVRAVLKASEADWNAANEAFMTALKAGPPGGPAIMRYGEVFRQPNVGRFATPGQSLEIKAKLATFDDYARVQGQLSAGVEAGIDPQAILAENGLTVYDWSQESGNWLKLVFAYDDDAQTPEKERERLKRQDIMRAYEAQYREKYKVKGKQKFGQE